MKDTKHIRQDFHSVAWVMPHGVGLWGAVGAQGVKKIIFFKHGHVAYQIHEDDEQNRMQVKFSSWGQTDDLGVRSKGQISLNFGYHFNSKIFYTKLCVCSYKYKIENILNRIFILLLGSCPRGGTWGSWWVKNFSVGICDGAPSTAHSS